MNAAPLFLGFAGKALLYLQKQQRILQAPAADLALISIICESLAAALKLPSSTPDIANNTKQQVHDAAPGLLKPLAKACTALADELQQALKQQQQQQQQQPSQGERSGLCGNSRRQQPAPQQQHQPAQLEEGLSVARGLQALWLDITLFELTKASCTALFAEALPRSTLLPTVKLVLVTLRAQDHPVAAAAGSSSSSSSARAAEEPLFIQMQSALALAVNIAQAITAGPYQQAELRQKHAVQQLLAAPELRQLMVAAAAWLTGLLHQQKQGRAAVDAASVVRSLSNSNAAATYTSAGSSSSSGGGGGKVPPHHARVLALLGMSAADPCRASSESARKFNKSMLAKCDVSLTEVLKALSSGLEMIVEGSPLLSKQRRTAETSGGVAYAASYYLVPRSSISSSSISSSSISISSTWQQLLPLLMGILGGTVLMWPAAEARAAAVAALMPAIGQDVGLWQQQVAAAAVSELVVQLGPAVLHAVQQQQRSQEDAKHCQFALYYWALAAANAVGAANHEHLAATIKQSTEAFAVSLCAAMRVLCAVTCSRASTAAAAANASSSAAAAAPDAAAAQVLWLLPVELTTALPPEALLSTVQQVATAAMAALHISKLAVSEDASAPNSEAAGSSSSSNAAEPEPAGHQYYFMVSLLLTAQKCASALRGACPRAALDVAASVGRNRIESSVRIAHTAWLQRQASRMSEAELRQLCFTWSSDELRARMWGPGTAAASDRELREVGK
uniref:Uncharacterized protein n=1 Tax=Tetradesmus obliquus TaxID=3088 RepID=A0A383VT63_TETOB|eukprot:jgi/Sobl393_1/2553/SZX67586.1